MSRRVPDGELGPAAVVLAAGRSQRFGTPKQLALLAGEPLISHVVERALASCVTHVVVVLGHDASRIRSTVPCDDRVRTIQNDRYRQGLSTSLIAGIDALDPGVVGAIVLMGDVPRVEPRDIDSVADALIEGYAAVRIRYRDGSGHPIGFRRSLWPQLRTLSGDEGARSVLLQSNVHEIEVSRLSPRDVDSPRDLAAVGRWLAG